LPFSPTKQHEDPDYHEAKTQEWQRAVIDRDGPLVHRGGARARLTESRSVPSDSCPANPCCALDLHQFELAIQHLGRRPRRLHGDERVLSPVHQQRWNRDLCQLSPSADPEQLVQQRAADGLAGRGATGLGPAPG
jgi:hypothetical protein